MKMMPFFFWLVLGDKVFTTIVRDGAGDRFAPWVKMLTSDLRP